MKYVISLLVGGLLWITALQAQSIDPVSLLLDKVVKAIDRKVQQMQNQVLRLQNLQKQAENALSLDKLSVISHTLQDQKTLYYTYYASLQQTKEQLLQSPRYLSVLSLRTDLLALYERSRSSIQGDTHLSGSERTEILSDLALLAHEIQTVTDKMVTALRAGTISATDAERLELIAATRRMLQQKADVLRRCIAEARALSLERAKDAMDAAAIRRLYGL